MVRFMVAATLLSACSEDGRDPNERVDCTASWQGRFGSDLNANFTGQCSPECDGYSVQEQAALTCAVNVQFTCADIRGAVYRTANGDPGCCIPQPVGDGEMRFDFVWVECQ